MAKKPAIKDDSKKIATSPKPKEKCKDHCRYSKAMYQPHPRLCVKCYNPEGIIY